MENGEELEVTKMGTWILRTLVDITHEIDSIRPVKAGMNNWHHVKNGYSDILDVAGYNYGYRYGEGSLDLNDHRIHLGRRIIGSETVAFYYHPWHL